MCHMPSVVAVLALLYFEVCMRVSVAFLSGAETMTRCKHRHLQTLGENRFQSFQHCSEINDACIRNNLVSSASDTAQRQHQYCHVQVALTHRRLLSPARVVQNRAWLYLRTVCTRCIADSDSTCSMRAWFAGTNVGVQIRKLYEPQLYPGAPVLPVSAHSALVRMRVIVLALS